MKQRLILDDNEKITSIQVKENTKQRIARYGTYGDSMDSILNKIIDQLEKEAEKKLSDEFKKKGKK